MCGYLVITIDHDLLSSTGQRKRCEGKWFNNELTLRGNTQSTIKTIFYNPYSILNVGHRPWDESQLNAATKETIEANIKNTAGAKAINRLPLEDLEQKFKQR